MADLHPDTPSVLARCRESVPVGVPLAAAIAAHQVATQERDHRAMFHGIRCVLMACAPTTEDLGRQRDYLAGLPLSAWSGIGWDAGRARRDALALVDANIRAFVH